MDRGRQMKEDYASLIAEVKADLAQEAAGAAEAPEAPDAGDNDNDGAVGVAEYALDEGTMINRLGTNSSNFKDRLEATMKATDRIAEIFESPELGTRTTAARRLEANEAEGKGKAPEGSKRGPYKKPLPKLEEALAAFHLQEDVKRSITVHASLEYAGVVEAIKMRHQTSYEVPERLVEATNLETEVEGALESLDTLVGMEHCLYLFGANLLRCIRIQKTQLEQLDLECLSVLR